MKMMVFCLIFLAALGGPGGGNPAGESPVRPRRRGRPRAAGRGGPEAGVVEIDAEIPGTAADGLRIEIRLRLPERGRYGDGGLVPVLVEVPPFLTGVSPGFHQTVRTGQLGIAHLSFRYPGGRGRKAVRTADGGFDFGGENCLRALRDVLRFALGKSRTVDGRSLADLALPHGLRPMSDNVGIFAFSHTGIAATNVLALHGEDLEGVRYFVGRENPTQDTTTAVELGHWDPRPPRYSANPLYLYPDSYDPREIAYDTATAGWDEGDIGYPFLVDGEGRRYLLGQRVPRMFGRRYYSRRLTRSLLENGALTREDWPADLATPEEAERDWPLRETVHHYELIGNKLPEFKVMLVFAADDHVQPAPDKPHIHQAWDGFRHRAGLPWVRMNPDEAYVRTIDPAAARGYPDLDANREPEDWSDVRTLGHGGSDIAVGFVFAAAAVAEMADRAALDDWRTNLEEVLDPADYREPAVSPGIGIFRPATGLWAVRGTTRFYFGGPGDVPVPADYSGRGKKEAAVFRASSGLWAVRSLTRFYFGREGDIPVPGDYRGTGPALPAIYRPERGLWSVRGVTRIYFGAPADLPVPGDYRGTGTDEPGIYRPATGLWAVRGVTRFYFGSAGDATVPGDYDGLGLQASGVFRPASGLWAVRGLTRAYFGRDGDHPVPADYLSEGIDRIAVFRSAAGLWAIFSLTRVYFGREGDIPVPGDY